MQHGFFIMDSGAEDIVNIYKNFGIAGVVIFLITILVVLQFSDFGKRVNKIIVERFFGKNALGTIPYDRFIRKLEHIRNFNIKKIIVNCPKRREIFRDFACNRIENLINFIKEIKTKNFDNMNNEELFFFFTENIYRVKEVSNSEVLKMGIPQEVIDKIKDMENDEVKIFNSLVSNICVSSSDYMTNREKVAVILDFLCALFSISVSNAENSIDSLNGQLDGFVYKGLDCSNCNVCCKKNKNRSFKNV